MIKWSILIATIGQRNDRFVVLLDHLMRQVKEYGNDEVEVLAYWNNGELPLARIRQRLVEKARGNYINFIDDDDSIPEYYVKEVLEALKKAPDYVGWRMQAYTNGNKLKPTFHSLKYDKWSEDDDGYYRDVSHLNPIKKQFAIEVPFEHQDGNPEDYNWALRVRPLLKTEVYIDKEMYQYYHVTEDSTWRGDIDKTRTWERPRARYKNFRFVK